MEAGKPGWNDALNGLPGMLGSSSSELIDLVSLVDFISSHLDRALMLPVRSYKINDFYKNLTESIL